MLQIKGAKAFGTKFVCANFYGEVVQFVFAIHTLEDYEANTKGTEYWMSEEFKLEDLLKEPV